MPGELAGVDAEREDGVSMVLGIVDEEAVLIDVEVDMAVMRVEVVL